MEAQRKDYALYSDGETTIVMEYEESDKESFIGMKGKVWNRCGKVLRQQFRKPAPSDIRWN